MATRANELLQEALSLPVEQRAQWHHDEPKRLGYHVAVKVRDLLRLLVDDGWILTSQRGSHRQFEHPHKPGKVTVPGHPGDEVAPGTLKSIRRQAGLEE